MDTHARAEELAKRPYMIMTSVDTTTEGQPIHFARVLEMEGCFGQGETSERAIEDLRLAMVDFIESLLGDGLPVPEPTRLVNTTMHTAAKSTLTFTAKGGEKRLQPKRETNQDAYVFAAHD